MDDNMICPVCGCDIGPDDIDVVAGVVYYKCPSCGFEDYSVDDIQ